MNWNAPRQRPPPSCHQLSAFHYPVPKKYVSIYQKWTVKRKQMWDSQKFDCCHSWDLAFSCRQTSAIEKPLPNIKGTPKKCWCKLWSVLYSFYTWIKPKKSPSNQTTVLWNIWIDKFTSKFSSGQYISRWTRLSPKISST